VAVGNRSGKENAGRAVTVEYLFVETTMQTALRSKVKITGEKRQGPSRPSRACSTQENPKNRKPKQRWSAAFGGKPEEGNGKKKAEKRGKLGSEIVTCSQQEVRGGGGPCNCPGLANPTEKLLGKGA